MNLIKAYISTYASDPCINGTIKINTYVYKITKKKNKKKTNL